jgi:hypothetical protein
VATFAGRARREGAAAESADRGVEDRGSRLDRRPAAGDAGVARVVEVTADRNAQNRDPVEQPADRPRCRDADRVGEDDLAGARSDERSASAATTPGSTSPSNGQPKER